MKNKTIVISWLIGIAMAFAGGFISGFNGALTGLSTLLTSVGTLVSFIFVVWAMIRLWKYQD